MCVHVFVCIYIHTASCTQPTNTHTHELVSLAHLGAVGLAGGELGNRSMSAASKTCQRLVKHLGAVGLAGNELGDSGSGGVGSVCVASRVGAALVWLQRHRKRCNLIR